jgi:glucosamine kinase
MTKDIYIGVDGGGTKCKVRIEDTDGKLLGEAVGGPSQIRLSVDQSWHSILDAIHKALQPSGISLDDKNYRFHAGFGLAGTEKKEAVRDFLAYPHPPFANIVLKSDAYTACLGAHGGKDGAIIIIGTGTIGMRIQGDELIQVGGWGFPHGDEGGGARIGLTAVCLTLQAYDGRVETSPLLQAIMKKFSNDTSKLVSFACDANATKFAEIAPLVIEYLEKDDFWSLAIINHAGREIDRIFTAMENRTANKTIELPYCLLGGIAEFLESWISAELSERLVSVQADATVGAIYMVKKQI